MDYGWLSLAIPILTIVAALLSKDTILSLLGGIFAGLLVLHHGNVPEAFTGLFNGLVTLLSEGWIAKTLLFSLFVGSIIALLEKSGAVARFVSYVDAHARRLDSPKGAQLLAYIVGIVIFIESSITALVAGTVAKPLCDKNGVCREKLAYICDATSAPVCSLIPLNAWGALLIGLIATAVEAHTISGNATALLIASLPFNFYAIFALLILLFSILKHADIGPMRACRPHAYEASEEKVEVKAELLPMLLPILLLVASVPAGLYITGKGDIFKGSGSTSVYYATIVTLLFGYLYFRVRKMLSHRDYLDALFEGMGTMLPIAAILLLALFIGKVIGDLGTAHYLAALLQGNLPSAVMPMLIFLTAAVTAFATGTSWGTFSIMMPIALSLSATMDLSVPLVIGAVISGGIFGDHASPISDTTVISSMAAGCDHIAHVRTQLPYALIGGILAALAFLVAGFI